MAKAKRERRTSIRTMDSDGGASDLLERMAKMEAEAARAVPAVTEAEATAEDQSSNGSGGGGDF